MSVAETALPESDERVFGVGPAVWALACVGLNLLLAVLLYEPTIFTGGDNANYMILGESLGTGQGYRDLYLPGAPIHGKYPPAYPAILAILGWFGGLQLFKVWSMFASATCVWLTWRLGRNLTVPRIGLLAAAIMAVSPLLLRFSHIVLTETTFAVLILLSLNAAARDQRPGAVSTSAMLLACAAFLTRTAGLPLLLALVIIPSLARRWRLAGRNAAVGVTCVVGWGLWQRFAAEGNAGYLSELAMVNPYDPSLGTVNGAGLAARIAKNFWLYISAELPEALGALSRMPEGPVLSAIVLGLVVTGLAVVGWLRSIDNRITAASIFLFLYVGMITLWPEIWTDKRFLLPVLPLIAIYAMYGVHGLVALRFPREGVMAAGALLLILGSPAAMRIARMVPLTLTCQVMYLDGDSCLPADYESFFAAGEWAREHVPEGSVLVNRHPRLFYLYSGHQGDVYEFSTDPEIVLRGLEAIGTTHVVLDRTSVTTDVYLRPVLTAFPDRFVEIYAGGSPVTRMYRMLRPPVLALDSGGAR